MSQLCSAAEATKRFAFVLFDLDNRRDEQAVPTVRTRYAISVQSVIEGTRHVCLLVRRLPGGRDDHPSG